jgi:hypothetical protein
VFELWDTGNARLVGTFPSESAALDAAYRELRGQQNEARPQLAVLRGKAAKPVAPGRARWGRIGSAVKGLSLRFA